MFVNPIMACEQSEVQTEIYVSDLQLKTGVIIQTILQVLFLKVPLKIYSGYFATLLFHKSDVHPVLTDCRQPRFVYIHSL